MPFENTAETQEFMDENYTCVSFESLQLRMPGSEDTGEDIVRDYPSEPLIGRDYDEIQKLRAHPFFRV